ncbi:polymorphic toxin-type HINT domain-containing protein [Microbacterium sp. NPDC087592]|uniref:polymorphic toxin-type HINT domain-containing protein n=1 Tax=Microbacterium sp. NPDC087592 TaxID=3364193 RepID=UPI00382D69CA
MLATDPETGKTSARPVVATITGTGVKDLVTVSVTDGSGQTGQVTATAGHPFWVPDIEEWVDAGELRPGMWVQTSSGTWVQVTAIEHDHREQTVHNLTIDTTHTYSVYAGADAVITHNCGVVDPGEIRFSQSSVSSTFRDGGSIADLAEGLKSGSIRPSDVPPIRLVERGNALFTLDNRRLLAFQQARVPIPFRMATPEEIATQAWKFTTGNEGISIIVRGLG